MPGGSIVGCIIAGEIGPIHVALIVPGLALIVVGWCRQRAPGSA